MSTSRVAALREKFQNANPSKSGGALPTPDVQLGNISKAKKDQAKAIRIAKARAARYNMTLRSLAIKTNTAIKQQNKKDLEKRKKIKNQQAKYNMTSRAIPIQINSKENKDKLNRALSTNISPSVAKEVLTTVAKTQTHTRLSRNQRGNPKAQPAQELKRQPLKAAPKPKEVEEPEEMPVEKPVEQPAVQPTEEPVEGKKRKQRIEMGGMNEALASGDEKALNRVVLMNFFETSAPHLVDKVDLFLNKYENRLQDLFDSVLQEFPSPDDANLSGRNKADHEIAEAVQSPATQTPSEKRTEDEKPSSPPQAVVDDQSEVYSQDSIAVVEEPAPVEAQTERRRPDKKKTLVQEALEEFELLEKNPELQKQTQSQQKPEEVDEEDENEESSIVAVDEKAQEEQFQKGYEERIISAEADPAKEIQNSLDRLEQEQKLLEETKQQEQAEQSRYKSRQSSVESFSSVVTRNSIVEYSESLVGVDQGYIVAADLEEDEANNRWAVQLQGRNEALEEKLLRQGLTKEQASELVQNFDLNTSEMM